MKSFLLRLLAFTLVVQAHKQILTKEDVELQRGLQAAVYHCAPTVERYTAARKRSWAQKVLGGRPSLAGYEDLFDETIYRDLGDEHDYVPGQKLLSCVEEEETEIRNNTCVLAPEVTEGPYYHRYDPIRQNIAEMQFGLLTLLDIGVIDIETCLPLPNVLVNIWHANATGHYAGHPRPAPHLVNEHPATEGKRKGLLTAFPRTNFENTWLRGAWATDRNGVAQFSTVFPGYYTGRALHIHTRVFTEWTPLPNGSFEPSRLSHTGQFFFDDDLVETTSKMWPYSTNPIRDTWGRTRNWADSLNIFNDSHGPERNYNPVFKAEKLGAVLNQGVLAFITMGVNKSASYDSGLKG